MKAVVFIVKATAVYSLQHGLHALTALPDCRDLLVFLLSV